MQIIRFEHLQEAPWKNGGGITREIAIRRNGDALVWRLSMADVSVDGPFSRFDGLHRILTVIEGNGMVLVGPQLSLDANHGMPVRFDGAWDIHAILNDGPLRDLNLIYDPRLCNAEAFVVHGKSDHVIEADSATTHVVHCFKGRVALGANDSLNCGDTALIENGSTVLQLGVNFSAVLVTLSHVI